MPEGNIVKISEGTPQGGVLSPLLANIYLHELDIFIEKLQKSFTKGVKKQPDLEFYKYKRQGMKASQIRHRFHLKDSYQFDENFKRLYYVRYADDFMIAIGGSKKDADKVFSLVNSFLETIKLELSPTKTLITNASKKRVLFLGYSIT